MANPLGIQGRPKFKPFRDALCLEITEAGDNQKRLRRIAAALLRKAEAGDLAAIAMVAERMDGKVPLPTGGSDELGPHRLHISWKGSE